MIAEGISKFSPQIWGDNEKALRLNPEIGHRSATYLEVDNSVKSPSVDLNTLGDTVELQKPNRSIGIEMNQANGHQFSSKKVTFTASKSQNIEQMTTSKEGHVRSPPKEDVQFTAKAVPKVRIKNHGRLAVEKISVGDKVDT